MTKRRCPSRLMNSWAKVTSVETLASSFSESHRTPASELWMPLYKSSAQRPCTHRRWRNTQKRNKRSHTPYSTFFSFLVVYIILCYYLSLATHSDTSLLTYSTTYACSSLCKVCFLQNVNERVRGLRNVRRRRWTSTEPGGCRLTGALVRRRMQPFLMSRRFCNTQTNMNTEEEVFLIC